MSDSVNLILTGATLPGHDPDTAAAALAKMLRLSEEQARALLGGRETLVKRALPAAQLGRYLAALDGAGIGVRTEPTAGAPAPLPQTTPRAEPPTAADDAAASALTLVGDETITCPACGAVQPRRNLCRECGADMPRMRAAQEAAARAPAAATPAASPYAAPRAVVRDVAGATDTHETPDALALSLAGRIGRLRYLAYAFPAMLPMIVGAFVGGLIGGAGHSGAAFAIVFGLSALVTVWLGIRVTVLRLHDLNRSGFWVFLPLAPAALAGFGSPALGLGAAVVLMLLSLLLCVLPGSREDNDYGLPPGPNTAWTVVGAVLMIALSVASGVTNGSRSAAQLMPAAAAPAQEE